MALDGQGIYLNDLVQIARAAVSEEPENARDYFLADPMIHLGG
jgi:hypothetical protein